ncbi:sulfite exporter TauE/SafE family protein [Nocardia speluncae]|uniref:Probable membrane transporter protein n=1 Tax=Nocardia speluncae TaxID=419477 RepID=A0A846XEQ6_9NOCA|nr:sulfite exporter TauE/SafE family protein [Nocardia speluncae]NKY33093.1 sulfite exporter TauE/SafE family protein [Nocardia speluncae]
MTSAIALALGAIIGVLLGLLGGGGSILAVPALVYGIGLDIEQAIPVSLIVVGTAAAVGALPRVRARHVEWRLAAVFAAAGIPATFAGSALGRLLPQPLLLIGFAAVMVFAAVRMLRGTEGSGIACKRTDTGIDWRRCASRSIPVGIGVGLLTGMFGVGGGFLIVPALVLMLGVQMPLAVGTSLLIIVANSAAGLVAHLGAGGIDWAVTGLFAGAALAGSLIAGHFGTKTNTERLQRWFAYLVFAVAAYVLVDTIFLT